MDTNSKQTLQIVNNFFLIVLLCLLCGCVGGPTHKYYNPSVVGAKFKGPVTMAMVEDVETEKARLVREGYTVIGSTDYGGKHPEAVELRKQAKRAGANHVIYSSHFVPNAPGSWSFSFGRGFGSGGSGGGHNQVRIVFLGKPAT
jgi:hypothetical protein